MKVIFRSCAVWLATVALMGCGGINSPSNNTTETFSGTVGPETGASTAPITHTFSANRQGEMWARLTSVTPNNATLVGLAFGEQIGGGCNIFTNSLLSGLNRDVMVWPLYQRGNFCLRVFNGGGINSTQNYTVQVSHP